MKTYNNREEIDLDLKRLRLERQIALEEMKYLKQGIKQDLRAYKWLNIALSAAKKYGVIYFMGKVFK